jgi:hypothetical protein
VNLTTRRMKSAVTFFFVFCLAAAVFQVLPAEAGVIYVNQANAGGGDGASWSSSLNEAQFASALQGAVSGDEFRVAAGTYRPTTGSDRMISFTLKSGVSLYGGFAGTEAVREDRDWKTNMTILTGDLLGNDSGTANNGENSYHVVVGSGTDTTAILDGFTVAGGNANGGGGGNTYYGGGLFISGGSPTVRHCIFTDNSTSNQGGGVYNNSANPVITECSFLRNKASGGGGMANMSGSNPTVTNCTFSENNGVTGGGMMNASSSPRVIGCTFSSNTTIAFGGGGGGGMYNYSCDSEVTNCTFVGNQSSSTMSTSVGGGMVNSWSSPAVTNCTFTGNRVTGQGGNLYNDYNSTPTVVNSIFWNAVGGEIVNASAIPTLRNCIVQSGDVGVGAIISNVTSADPLLAPLADNGGLTMTCAIPSGSPAVNAGEAVGAIVLGSVTVPGTDQRGVVRPQGNGVDIGAYEFAVSVPPVLVTPENGATGISKTPALETEEFSHPAGLTQTMTQWQVGTDETFGSGIVVDETSDTALTSFTLPDGVLENGTTYYWRVRFQDSEGNWSDWSDTWSFTTSSAGGGGGGGCQAGALPGLFALLLPLIFFRFNGKVVR